MSFGAPVQQCVPGRRKLTQILSIFALVFLPEPPVTITILAIILLAIYVAAGSI
jgi:energy-coupling factor transporter transmembrane protein EcfT